MSILIKGMKMPKNCDDCFFIGRGYPDWCSLPQIPNGEDEINDTKKRPDWCPLVELPEKHGRLIDGDAVFEWYIKAFNSYPKIEPNEVRFSMNDIAGNLLNMPTIIEAEGDEE